MRYFKKEASRFAGRFLIAPDSFERATERKYPFEQKFNGKTAQYGICPSCLNPIQLIGITNASRVTPYGRHTLRDIPDLASWDQQKYEYCPYASPNIHREISEDELLPETTDSVRELYSLLRDNFDRVVYVVQKTLDIRCSLNFWSNALKQYLENKAYLYPWLTEANLPYVFALRGMTHSSVYGQQVRLDSELYKALETHKNIRFGFPNTRSETYRTISNQKEYLKMEFRFFDHRQQAQDGRMLTETITFCVDDLISGDTVFEKTIRIDETFFMNIVDSTVSKHKRNRQLLNISHELMKDI